MIGRFVSFFLVIFVLSGHYVNAQDTSSATFTADQGSPAIGEPIQLTLTVQIPSQSVVNMPQFAETWSSFMVKKVGDVTMTTTNGFSVYHQTLTVILWQPGDYQTPETIVAYQPPGSDQLSQLVVEPAFFSVPSVLNDNDLVLRPFKPPINLPYISLWLITAFLALAVVLSVLLVRYLRSHKSCFYSQTVGDPSSNFHASAQAAFRELKRITEKINNPSEIYAQTADCLRVYLHGRFDVFADDMTTREIQNALESKSILAERQQQELEHLLERADLVKFARIDPKTASAQQYILAAQRWIQTVEQAEGSETR